MMHHSENNNKESITGVSKVDSTKSSCVAWFKLAELVSRKEKEKALNLYRLISHSFEDKAYALQVEGDILWALEDNNALEKYTQAAYLYKKERRLVSATAVYEHLLVLEPNKFDYLKTLILLYLFLSWNEKFEERYLKLLNLSKEGIIEFGKIWDFTKNLIDFSFNKKRFSSGDFEQEHEINLKKPSEYKWLLKSLNCVI
ncbi:hypothetical protein GF385_01205, partial [Candidatus Dependentiae bacterium]|nr:hypothetical protein [Candidatus Dependentiae bacterium]